MGKGDKRSRKGKIFKGSFGNSRPRKSSKRVPAKVVAAAPIVAVKSEAPVKKTAVRKKKKEDS